MKPVRSFSQTLLWSSMVVVIVAVIAAGILTNITLRSIEKKLPNTLLTELRDLSQILNDLAKIVSTAEITQVRPNPENFNQLRREVKIVYDGVVKLRHTYVFDNLVQASALHAVIAPAIADLQIWLSEGVSGYGPETDTTINIALSRISQAFHKARAMNYDSQITALKIMNEQRSRLDQFLFSVNMLFMLTLLITIVMVLLLIRQHVLQRQEAEAHVERRRAEEELQKLASVIKYTSELVNLATLDGKMIFLNESGGKMLGIDPDDVERIHIMEVIPDHMKELVENELLPTLMQGNTWEGELQYLNIKTGDLIDVHAMTFTVKEPNTQKPLFLANVSIDITERKRAEEEKAKLESQLQQAQKMEAMGTLAGGIAHDFNNLLMGIQGRASLMLMDTDTSHSHSEHLKVIEDYVKSAAELTKQLLGFARGGKYEVKPTDLNELIKRENKMFGRTRKEINIQENFEQNLWAVEVDHGQIEQVILNIYVNAWQAMPGGGYLHIQTENAIINEDYSKLYQVEPGNYVKISITDTGAGMDETTRQRIFDPFFTTKEIGRGTGLGLASAYGIIKNHNGFINVYSEKGEGTTFNIYLPASEKEAVKEEAPSKKLLGGTETILLVDDEDMIVDVGCGIIEKLGYKVLTAKSGKEAIEIYEKNRGQIDLVILDMIMPDIGGGETYDRLKQINPNIKVLLSSGYSINGQATEILERGCDGFIQKPFNMTDLSQKMRDILDKD